MIDCYRHQTGQEQSQGASEEGRRGQESGGRRGTPDSRHFAGLPPVSAAPQPRSASFVASVCHITRIECVRLVLILSDSRALLLQRPVRSQSLVSWNVWRRTTRSGNRLACVPGEHSCPFSVVNHRRRSPMICFIQFRFECLNCQRSVCAVCQFCHV